MTSSNGSNPVMRKDSLITSETERDLLVYDQINHSLHTLNDVTSSVWALCDGIRSTEMMAKETGFTVEAVHLALGKLHEASLITGQVDAPVLSRSRRRMLKGAAVAIPTIVSITAPLASAVASVRCAEIIGQSQDCDPGNDCCGLDRFGNALACFKISATNGTCELAN